MNVVLLSLIFLCSKDALCEYQVRDCMKPFMKYEKVSPKLKSRAFQLCFKVEK